MSQDTGIDDCEVEASVRLAEVFDVSMIDVLLVEARASGTPIDGAGWVGEPDGEGEGFQK